MAHLSASFLSRSGTVGAPSLRSLQGRVRCCLYHGVCYAQRSASHLRRSSPALYHYLVLPAITFSAHHAQPRYLPHDSGTDARALPLRSRRLCRDARTHSPAFDGTRSWDSLDRDASVEAAHGPRFATQMQTEEPTPTQSVWRRAEAQSVLAGAILRLQRMDDEEARGEAQVHASQSSEARLGRRTGGVAVEQLSFLSSGRSRAGASERRLDEDFVPESGGVASQLQTFVVPALRKRTRRTGHPLRWRCQRKQRLGHPPQTPFGLSRLLCTLVLSWPFHCAFSAGENVPSSL